MKQSVFFRLVTIVAGLSSLYAQSQEFGTLQKVKPGPWGELSFFETSLEPEEWRILSPKEREPIYWHLPGTSHEESLKWLEQIGLPRNTLSICE